MAKSKFNAFELYAILFEQLERLNENEIKDVDLEREMRRAQAVTSVADRIIDVAKTEVAMQTIIVKSMHVGSKSEGIPSNQLPQVGFFTSEDSKF